jgi:hypothetical protein
MMRKPLRQLALSALGVAALMLCGCVTLTRTPFSVAEQSLASPPGFSHVRYTQDDPALTTMLSTMVRPDGHGEVNALALSGGGANGAYGAGLLYGWTKTGTRPEFQIVTGVSTGALTAPFAFLGSGTDEQLREAYTGEKVRHLLEFRGAYGLFTPGLYNKLPLENLVRSYVTDDVVHAVAAQYAKGRRLMIATTNLDTEQLIVWDMGAIAAHGGPAARALFVKVLVASASVPGVFSPTMIEVKSGGRTFSEMHIDGQTEGAFFAVPEGLLLMKKLPAAPFKVRLFVVINGQLDSVFSVTPHATIPILARAIDTANKAAMRSVVTTTVEFCARRGCLLKLAALPPLAKDDPLDFGAPHLQALFEAGQAAIAGGTAWRDSPVQPVLAPPP